MSKIIGIDLGTTQLGRVRRVMQGGETGWSFPTKKGGAPRRPSVVAIHQRWRAGLVGQVAKRHKR